MTYTFSESEAHVIPPSHSCTCTKLVSSCWPRVRLTVLSSSRMLTSLGCCYMKINQHFPMSRHVSSQPWSCLTYTSTELSCHAIEMYADKLRLGEEEKLKVHCYRAVLEEMLVGRDPQYRHTILKTVNKPHLLSFSDYVSRATAGLVSHGMPAFTEQELQGEAVTLKLKQWWRVVTFYSVRLAFAPVIGRSSHYRLIYKHNLSCFSFRNCDTAGQMFVPLREWFRQYHISSV